MFFSQEDLFRILKAYTIHNPTDGYCQAQVSFLLGKHSLNCKDADWIGTN